MGETTIAGGVGGVEELDFAGPYEVLTAWSLVAGKPVSVVTVAERPTRYAARTGCASCPTWPGPTWRDRRARPAGWDRSTAARGHALARAAARARGRRHADGERLHGRARLAAAGLLDGRPATTHWGSLDALAGYGRVEVRPDERFVDDGNVITSAGVSAGIDMALHLVARLDSDERSREVRGYIEYDPA